MYVCDILEHGVPQIFIILIYVCDSSEQGVPQIFIILIYVCDSSEQGVQRISIMQSSMMSVCLSVRMELNISQTTGPIRVSFFKDCKF